LLQNTQGWFMRIISVLFFMLLSVPSPLLAWLFSVQSSNVNVNHFLAKKWLNTKPRGVNTGFDSCLWKDILRQMKIEAQRLVYETMILCSHLSTVSHLNFGHIHSHQFPSPTNFCIEPK